MSIDEYRYHKTNGFVWKNTEWAEQVLEREEYGVSLLMLKKWVDEGRSTNGSHDLVVRINGSVPEEFAVSPTSVTPKRYVNIIHMPFERTEVVYDPRAVVSKEPVRTLEDVL